MAAKKSVKINDVPTVQEAPAAPSKKRKADISSKLAVLDKEHAIRQMELFHEEYMKQHEDIVTRGDAQMFVTEALCKIEVSAAEIRQKRVLLEIFKAGFNWE